MNGKKKLKVNYDPNGRNEIYSIFKENEETVKLFEIQYNLDHQILKVTSFNPLSPLAELSVIYSRYSCQFYINNIDILLSYFNIIYILIISFIESKYLNYFYYSL